MGRENAQLIAMNRGLVSRYALARIDLAKLRYAASKMTNWMPRVLGPMMLRPGLQYITGTQSNAKAKPVPFIRSATDTAILEFTDSLMAVLVADVPITRPAVSAAITNGTFGADISGWTTGDTETGASVAWASPTYMRFTSNGTSLAAAYQSVSVTAGQKNTEHALRIVVKRGPLFLKVGSSAGLDDIVPVQQLNAGTYSMALNPAGASAFVVYFYSRGNRICDLDGVAIEAAGVMTLPTPWALAALPNLRWDQSADVVYIGDNSVQQRQIERHATRSWGIAAYAPEDGPFRAINTTGISITSSALSGDVTLTASGALFEATHVGALFRLSSQGQFVKVVATGANQWSNAVRVTGVGNGRKFTWIVSGTYSGTVKVQSSTTGPSGPWGTFDSTTGTGSHTANDTLDNEIIWYRIGIDSGDYISGTATGTISFSGGSLDGIVRITSYSSGVSAGASVLGALGNTTATTFWYEGAWSDLRGWPSCPAILEDRLWWFGYGKEYGSVTDAFSSFDDSVTGDSGPIQRSVGSGPVDRFMWSLGMLRLIAGTASAEISARSDSFDTPLTPTNFNLKTPSRQGSANIKAVALDDHGYFVQASGARIFKLDFDSTSYVKMDYIASDATAIVPEIGLPSDDAPAVDRSFVALVVQRQPDTRIHGVRADGTVAVLIVDKVEEVECWVEIETPGAGGFVEDAVVLPGPLEDQVYYVVRRTIGGATKRYYEKWAQEQECKGLTLNKQADSFVVYSGAPTRTISAAHLEGQQVCVWADGKDLSPGVGAGQTLFTITGGVATLPSAVSNYVAGLPYQAPFFGVKLAYGAQMGTALTKRKRIISVGMILADTHSHGIQYGSDADHLDDMPGTEDGAAVDYDTVWQDYDKDSFAFSGTWNTDSRVYLLASAPRPCKVMALVVNLDTKEGT